MTNKWFKDSSIKDTVILFTNQRYSVNCKHKNNGKYKYRHNSNINTNTIANCTVDEHVHVQYIVCRSGAILHTCYIAPATRINIILQQGLPHKCPLKSGRKRAI